MHCAHLSADANDDKTPAHPLNFERVESTKEKTDLSEIEVKQAAEFMPLPAHSFLLQGNIP